MDPTEPPFAPSHNLPPKPLAPAVTRTHFWRVLFVSLLGAGFVGTIAYWGYGRYKDRKLYRPESSVQRELKVKDAFTGAPEDLTTAEARSVDRFFKEQGDAQNRKDIPWQLNHYDFIAMLETVQAHADFPDADKFISYLKKNEQVMQTAMKGQFAQFLTILSYSKHRLQRLEFNQSKTLALAYVLATDADGVHTRSRVWLKKEGSSWLIYDEEQVEMGLRNSSIIGNMIGSKTLPKMNQAVLNFAKMVQFVQNGDIEESEKLIDSLKRSVLPSQLKGVVYFIDASLLLSEMKYDEALESVAEVRRLVPDSVGVEQLSATIYSAMEKHEEALAAARKFMDFLGLDPESVVVACNALKAQQKPEEARDLLVRTLKDFPDDTTLLELLPKLATAEQMKSAITNALKVTADPEALFETLASEYQMLDESEALLSLSSTMREQHPESESLKLYQIRADDALLIKRAKADLAEATADLQKQFQGEAAAGNLHRLTGNLELPQDEGLYSALCTIFAESQPNATKELAKAKAGLTLGMCYAEMDKEDGDAAAYFEIKLSDRSQRETYIRLLADAACVEADSGLLTDLLDALKKVEPDSPLLGEYLAKLKKLEAEDETLEK
jgi:tetratricopeptide (TPR) repeat protein